jgi:hypothetical protein
MIPKTTACTRDSLPSGVLVILSTGSSVIRARSALLATTDGGKSWKPVIPVNDPAWSQKLLETVAHGSGFYASSHPCRWGWRGVSFDLLGVPPSRYSAVASWRKFQNWLSGK